MMKKYSISVLALLLCIPGIVSAHQPRIPEGNQITVTDPEISKAYYHKLNGAPDTYSISSDKPFSLYVNILVPDIAGQKKDVSAVIIRNKDVESPTALNGNNFEWKKFFEPFGNDTYWMGPEYREKVGPGVYEIIISSPNKDSKYSLAIGETESFSLGETFNAVTLIPKIKSDFFNESPAGFIFSPFGFGLLLIMFVLAFAFGCIYRLILRKMAQSTVRKVHKNIGTSDRLVRLAIAIGLLAWAITTSWSPILLFFSGFVFFEAIFSWCGLYAALGKSTCPLE